MAKHEQRGVKTLIGLVLAIVFAGTCVPSLTRGQFGLPKIPKLPKKAAKKKETKPAEQATPEVAASSAASPQIALISPDSAPPGGSGQLVITGKNLSDKMEFRLNCKGGYIEPQSVKVESPARMVAQIKVPLDVEEGPCGTQVASKGEPFRISNSASMPVVLQVVYLGEGDMDFMQLMMKMQPALAQAAKGNWQSGEATPAQTKSGLEVTPGTLKFYDAGKVVFQEAASGVKSMGEMTQANEPTGIFRIVFNDGKIHNFMDQSGGSSNKRVFLYIKKRLGK